jgi:hypothetical protein
MTTAKVVDLMEALRKSLSGGGSPRARAERFARPRRKPPAKRGYARHDQRYQDHRPSLAKAANEDGRGEARHGTAHPGRSGIPGDAQRLSERATVRHLGLVSIAQNLQYESLAAEVDELREELVRVRHY